MGAKQHLWVGVRWGRVGRGGVERGEDGRRKVCGKTHMLICSNV